MVVKWSAALPGAEVLRPAAEHRIHLRNDHAEVRVTPRPAGQGPDPRPHPRHRAWRRPPLQKEDASPRPLPHGAAHALAQVTPEEVKPLASAREVDRLVFSGCSSSPRRVSTALTRAGLPRPAASCHTSPRSRRHSGPACREAHTGPPTPGRGHAGRCWRAAAR